MEQRMTWDEMATKYPGRWVVVKDADMTGPDIMSGVLVAVKTDDEIVPFRLSNTHKDYEICRTTEGGFHGIIDTDFSIAVN